MESRIPLPTDSIYKFYALLGLLLFIFSAGSLLYVNKSTNALLFESIPRLTGLQEIAEPSAVEKATRDALARQVELAIQDKETLTLASQILMLIGTGMMLFGFGKWHYEIQPRQDEAAKLELEKLRIEVERLKKEDFDLLDK